MSKNKNKPELAFGQALGTAPGNVVSYSSDYKTAKDIEYPTRSHYRNYVDGIYMGYKWQCVEFARRWLYVNHGMIFNDVAMAYEIFNLRYIRDVKNNTELPLNAFANGSSRPPEPGCMLIWDEGGEFEETGHVAIITEVFDDKIRIIEQNMDFCTWGDDTDYSREIKAKIGNAGDYWLQCPSTDSTILGWVMQTDNAAHSEPLDEPDKSKWNLLAKNVADQQQENPQALKETLEEPWLNLANDDEQAYVAMMDGHTLTCNPERALSYYQISSEAADMIESATDELHQMFMHATEYVLDHPKLLEKFGLPSAILQKIKSSWANRKNQLITSRFDFALCEEGLKVYEYNCDSASCYMEVGKVQGKWFKHFEVKGGVDAGEKLFKRLVKAWQQCELNGLVHVLQDDDPEETYHALFMKSAIEAAGYDCEVVKGLSSLTIGENGEVLDCNKQPIKWVWKTWAWETALDELRQDDASLNEQKGGKTPTLSDVLFNDDIMVFEPLWTLIPSNKAILPVLWTMFPNHPYLLNCDFALNDDLIASGYVSKPIVGRCGANIELVDKQQNRLEYKAGNFEDRPQIFQQLFALPLIDQLYVQVCSFTAQGNYAGSGVRVDSSMIIGKDSDCLALQVSYD